MPGTPSTPGRMRRRPGRWLVAGLAVALHALPKPPGLADVYQDRRAETGTKLFRALLAADLDLERKTTSDGRLLVLFFYTDDRKRADERAKAFGKAATPEAVEPIRGLPVSMETTADPSFAQYPRRLPAGIFLAQPPDAAALRSIVRFGIANKIIIYSPFEGHVESGVLGGLVVEAQVRPYINEGTLTASNIRLKDFFLKVTKVYR
jgi:hypothetical protein